MADVVDVESMEAQAVETAPKEVSSTENAPATGN